MRIIPIHPRVAALARRVRFTPTDKLFEEAWKQSRIAAGRPAIRFHDLRHGAGWEMMNAGIDPFTDGGVLGLKSCRIDEAIFSPGHGPACGSRRQDWVQKEESGLRQNNRYREDSPEIAKNANPLLGRWCRGPDSNRQAVKRRILSPLRLLIILAIANHQTAATGRDKDRPQSDTSA